jgi:hypothetical protein
VRRFAYRLLLTPGGAHFRLNVDALLASLSSRQLNEWMAFAALEPFGPHREDQRAGVIAAAIINSRFGRKAGDTGKVPADFFPVLRQDEAKPRQSWQSMQGLLLAFTKARGGEVR